MYILSMNMPHIITNFYILKLTISQKNCCFYWFYIYVFRVQRWSKLNIYCIIVVCKILFEQCCRKKNFFCQIMYSTFSFLKVRLNKHIDWLALQLMHCYILKIIYLILYMTSIFISILKFVTLLIGLVLNNYEKT